MKLLFFDDHYVAARPNIERRYFRPEKLGEFHDGTDQLQLYTSYFYDPTVGKYRLYYEAPIPGLGTEVRTLKLYEADSAEALLGGQAVRREVVLPQEHHGIHGCSVLLNLAAPAERRYLMVGNAYAEDKKKRYFCRAFSADGLTFTDLERIDPTCQGSDYKDTYNSVYYNPHTEEYVATTRCTIMDRRVAVIRSKDGKEWSKPRLLLHPTSDGNFGTQYYALGVSRLEGVFYGILWRFITDLDHPDFTDMGGQMENDLLYSYDGDCFTPTGLAPLCRRPAPPEYGCSQLWLLNMVEQGDRYILCGGATNIDHGAAYGDDKFAVTVFYAIRKDGFCALGGDSEKSIVYTKPFIYEGGPIRLNYDAKAGQLAVAILDANGTPVAGFDFADAAPLTGTEQVDAPLPFDTEPLCGKRIRFAFRLNGAKLYAVTFEGRPDFHG